MTDNHKQLPDPTGMEKELMEQRMLAFIFPNHPRTAREKEVFAKAVRYQIDHEKTLADSNSEVGSLPHGVESFQIGDFSMTFDGSATDHLTRKTICPYAYGLLLREGLLYKGVERAY